MIPAKIRVLADPAALAHSAAELVADAAASAIRAQGSFSLGLSGGRTPRPLYELLGSEAWIPRIDWSATQIYFVDERCLPPTHADSNFHLVSESLLEQVPIPPENIHRMKGEIDPQASAVEYGRMLNANFGDAGLDLAILGMGEDGHTASLFPNSPALAEKDHRCVANWVEELKSWRITMTAPFLNRSAQVLVLVSGASKAATVQKVLEGGPDDLPINLINPATGQVVWLMDSAAAGMAL